MGTAPAAARQAPEDRGRTTISDRVAERVAAAALTEVDGVGGVAKRVLGVALSGDTADRAARVDATVSGDRTTLEVHLSVDYPTPVATTTRKAREHLVERVGELTGLAVDRVDITVTALRPDASERKRRVR
ncbi:Asp23/Gls24 family envelope stress response protein [Actinokineospora bangkokensis]|uniref:Asp23/Gls24 family envelope stress response protein n=1 Tax=Actinokineospora bangkokensis TaxID=1193682 RepID=A0A1Q9LMK7_9PSEU|nr:Asp23/Gls24 family envelope stress response protein [Actinokineospora bangkokensis]OLR93276.1 hypothetical protein BJP25_17495 [Actinokineospora bangkokensis]